MSIVSGIEQGRETNPQLNTLQALTSVLGVKLDDLAPVTDKGRHARDN